MPNIQELSWRLWVIDNLLSAWAEGATDVLYHVVAVHLRVGVPYSSLGHQILSQESTCIIASKAVGIDVYSVGIALDTADSRVQNGERSMKCNNFLL